MSVEDIDYSDLDAVNRDVIAVRRRLVDSRRAQDAARAERTQKKLEWQHARNLALVQLSAETEANRTALVDLQTQGDLSEYLIANGVYVETEQVAKEVRSDMEALKEQGNNMRRQIEMGYR